MNTQVNLPALINTCACLCFLIGSLLWLPPFADYAVLGVWCFVAGSGLMLTTCLHDLLNPKTPSQESR